MTTSKGTLTAAAIEESFCPFCSTRLVVTFDNRYYEDRHLSCSSCGHFTYTSNTIKTTKAKVSNRPEERYEQHNDGQLGTYRGLLALYGL